MSEIKKLIDRLCPDGVEWEKLVDNVDVLYGYPFDSRLFCEDETFMPLIRIRDVKPAKASTYYSGEVIEEYRITKGDILVGMDGNFNLEKWNDVDGLLNQRVCKLSSKNEDKILNGFIYHYLKPVFKSIEGELNSGTVIHLSAKRINIIEIPVPPIEVQSKIVEILDNFTELEAELEIKLEAELEARRKQYEYYRNQLLTFDEDKGARFDVKWMKMSDIGTFTRGKRFVRTDIVEDGVPCIHYGDMYTYYGLKADKAKTHLTPEKAQKMRFAKKNDVVIVGAGENKNDIGVGVAWLGEEDVAVHDACYIFSSDLYPQYVSHFLRTEAYHKQIYPLVSEGKICSISAQSIGRAIIPIPPLEEQKRIVSILDRFEALTTDLQSGLPAEIEARRKQYEYYREKLLTFKRKTA